VRAETVMEAVREFVSRVTERCSPRVRSITLYGSWARGTARPDSDIDLFVLVDRRDAALAEDIQGVALEVDLERLTRLSVKICPEDRLAAMRRLGDPFLRAIETEGRLLWTPNSKDVFATG
jgi:predicted nucleotidyltransferase